MATVQRFEDLKVWQLSRSLAQAIYELTNAGSFSKDFELKNQLSRSSGSVMDNIAEGFGRNGKAEFKQYLSVSLGSISEVKSQLYRAYDRKHLTSTQFDDLYGLADQITRMIVSLMKYLADIDHRGSKFLEETPAYENYKP